MRTKTELDNVIEALNRQRDRLPEYSFKGEKNEDYYEDILIELLESST